MQINSDKRLLLVVSHKSKQTWVKIGSDVIRKGSLVKLLGVYIDNKQYVRNTNLYKLVYTYVTLYVH